MDREHIKKQLPSITENQLDILQFWSIRGWDDVSHGLGMSIDLKKQPRFRSLGLELISLEQFQQEAEETERDRILKIIKETPSLEKNYRLLIELITQSDTNTSEVKDGS